MKTRLVAVVLLGVAFASAGVAAGGDAKADLKKFAGTWAVESARQGGQQPADEVEKLRLTFAGDKVTLKHDKDADKEKKGTFKIDPTKKPRQIDLNILDKTMEGIYAFEGGKLKICVGQSGEARPTEFKSVVGSKTLLVVLKRAKK